MASPRPNTFNHPQPFLANGSNGAGNIGSNMASGHGRVVHAGPVRILCVADVRGNLRSLNDLARQARADYIVHTGDFGFYDDQSLERIADKTLKHVAQYSPLISEKIKRDIALPAPQQVPIKQRYAAHDLPLSELPLLINRKLALEVPVYTVWGACEDVRVLEKFRSGEYKVDKLHIIDEANSRLLDVGGVKLRLLGLGGAVVMHKLFDNGDGRTTIAGAQGTMWTTLLQMGELVDTANRVYDPTETRIFVTHASPAREGLLNQLSVTLKADFSISAGLHFRYGSSYNEFSVNPTLDHYRGKLAASKASFNDVWETVKGEVEPAVAQNETQQTLLHNALEIVQKMPSVANGGNPFGGPVGGANAGQIDEGAFKNMWNFNLADAAFGYLVLEVDSGRIGTEMKAQGFNFAHRGGKYGSSQPQQHQPVSAPAVSSASPTDKAASTVGIQSAPFNEKTAPPMSNAQGRQAPGPPPPPPPQQQQQQQGQARPGPGPGRGNQSPAPPRNNQPSGAGGPGRASTTPQPGQSNFNAPPSNNTDKGGAPPPPQPDVRNGTSGNETTPSGTSNAAATQDVPGPERKGTGALWVSNVKDIEACRALFTEEERDKILRIHQNQRGIHIVRFKTLEDAETALEHQPAERKGTVAHGLVLVKMYLEGSSRYSQGDGAGRWPGRNRGGGGGGGGGNNNNSAPNNAPNNNSNNNQGGQGAGYRSGGNDGARSGGGGGGATSDSEGGRGGRGGSFRGGASRGRGDRPRGGRGGRGSFQSNPNNNSTANSNNNNNNNNGGGGGSGNKGDGPASSTPANASAPVPAAASAPSGGES